MLQEHKISQQLTERKQMWAVENPILGAGSIIIEKSNK